MSKLHVGKLPQRPN